MSPERHQQITELLAEALERDPAERSVFLAAACAGDADLRREIESLIDSLAEQEDFIEEAPWAGVNALLDGQGTDSLRDLLTDSAEDAQSAVMTGKRVGAYRIIREIGHGGMGSIYLAERADKEYREQVALKIVRRGMKTDFVLRRFRHERQILATLHHPNIAALLDGGTTEDGLPYFVMEYIEGEAIDDYCDHHQLSIAERINIFRQVCAAVHYAHQSLVIHRDIKPGNILITADGTPKLLDFGIAKILNPEISQTIEPTATVMRLMTPEYASPEQVRGEPVTTATDVYSLGIVLYELLTGHRPYRISNVSSLEIERVICGQEPVRPSAIVDQTEERLATNGDEIRITPELISRARRTQPEKLRRRLGGDLDNIVLMALRKEPLRRYASVEHLAEDLRRHLEGLPVTARRDTFTYRAGKFIRRNKAGVAAISLVALSMFAGLLATIWQARRAEAAQAKAERRFNDVRKLANSYLFEFHDAIAELPGTTAARELVVKRALEYLDSLALEATDDFTLQQELASAYLKVGDVQGRPGHANLGDRAGAITSYKKAAAIRERIFRSGKQTTEQTQELVICYQRIGDTLQFVDSAAALAAYRRGLEVLSSTSTTSTAPLGVESTFADLRQRIGEMLAATGDLAGAKENQRAALEYFESVAAAAPNDAKAQRSLFINYIKSGNLLAGADKAAALRLYRQALPVARKLAMSDPLNARAQRELAAAIDKVGNMLAATGDREGALAQYREAFEIRKRNFSADPKNAEFIRDLSISHDKFGGLLMASGDVAAALAHFREALRLDSTLPDTDSGNKLDRASSLEKIGDLLYKSGDLAGAIENHDRARKLREEAVNEDPKNAAARRDLAGSYARLGDLSTALAHQFPSASQTRRQQARQWYQRSLDSWTELKNSNPLSPQETEEMEKLMREIAQCDAALKKPGS